MTYVATITSKRQLTIPVGIFTDFGLKEGQKLLLSADENGRLIKVEPVSSVLERLAGSVKMPKRFKNKSVEEIIELAKKEYFAKQ